MSLYYTNNENVVSRFSFKSVDVTGEFVDNLGEVKVTQTWVNEAENEVSGIYLFSLKEDYILNKFRVCIGEMDFSGVVSEPNDRNNERKELIQKYNDFRMLSLLHKFNKTDYCVLLGVIESQSEVVVEFSFLMRAESNMGGSCHLLYTQCGTTTSRT